MAETEPDYKNKHSQVIHLDTYHGVACDLMELNKQVADGFMRVSDMRSDIVIVQKPQNRVRDYDEIGFVRVAKFLKLPRLDFWKNDNELVQIKKEGDAWYVAINDQDLADKVARTEGDNRKFDERFVDAFQYEVKNALTSCLKREKLLNGGKYNLSFLTSYLGLAFCDLLLVSALPVALLNRNISFTGEIIAVMVAVNALYNGINCIMAASNYIEQRLWEDRDFFVKPSLSVPSFNDPFVRHSLPEFIMPPVPIDRIIRGARYLGQHGNHLIRYTK